ncbi:chromate efflux transporter [Longimicrobium sp.]|uniref:chromate efflux transporter n=1 Tax=Longimicrobium sp. TaxID=2029185 RepID=UPI003B3B4D09
MHPSSPAPLPVDPPPAGPPPLTLREAIPTWARVGALGFGGPAGQIAVLHRIVVEEKEWVDEPRFLHALNFCMLLPGPEAQQLATYVGWMMHGVRGGLAAGILFILPGFFILSVLSALYAAYQETTFVAALFFGLKAAIIAVVVEALLRIGKRALKGRGAYAIAAAAFISLSLLNIPFPIVVLGAGLAGWLMARNADPATQTTVSAPGERVSWRRTARVVAVCFVLWWAPVALLAMLFGTRSVWVTEGLFFGHAATVTFGGAYALLAYVAQHAVENYGWLGPGEMLDGLGLAETTPGPLILVVQFVAFLGAWRDPGPLPPLVAGLLGATLTAWVTFAPSFMFIFAGAPYVERLRGNRGLSAALAGITAAVVGVILNLAVWFALHVLFARVNKVDAGPFHLLVPDWRTLDVASLLIALGAAFALFRLKWGMLPTLAAAVAAGLAVRLIG